MEFIDTHPIQTGIVFVLISKLLIFIQVISTNKDDEKSKRFMTWNRFFKEYLYLVFFLIYGLSLIFRNI